MKRRWIEAATILMTAGVIGLTGCGMNSIASQNLPSSPGGGLPITAATSPHGEAFGGQQPVSGMSLQLYAAGSGGYGSAASTLFAAPTLTTATGGFSFPTYACPTPSTQVYLVGTGGDPVAGNAGVGTAANPNLALMVALGSCGNLNSGTHIHMNELTTVAAVWALAPFMSGTTTSYLNIGTSSTNATGLQLAFAASSEVVNTSTGVFPGNLPAGATLPTPELNTLADVMEACINSKGGVANDGSTSCGSLFGLTPNPAGTAFPADTITAAMNMALNPARNVTALNNLVGGTPAFEPDLGTAPNAWTVAIQYTGGGLNQPKTIAADQSGNIWVSNSGSQAVSLFDNLGNSKLGTTGTTLGGTPAGVAVDLAGNAWVSASNNTVYELNSSGANTSSLTGNGLNLPTAIAIDPSGVIWTVNSGSSANSVSAFTSTGLTLNGSPFSVAGIASPVGIAINGAANANCANCK
jgi:hypothetical protein